MRKVITYGTFDLFHQGHYNIIKRAKEQGDYLIVGVTSKSYDIDRGKLSVHDDIATRIENVKKTGLADEIIIEEYLGQKIDDIKNHDIDVLVVGSDWIGKFDHLKQYCDVVYLERTKNISSTQIREEMNSIYKIGIITDKPNDHGIVLETKYVSGIHVESVYSPNKAYADEICEKCELNSSFDNIDEFSDSIGIVCIKTDIESRAKYIREMLSRGKHVICDYPFTMDKEESDQLKKLSKDKGVLLVADVVSVYLRAFTQITWMAQGNVIGKPLGLNISMSNDLFENETDFEQMVIYPTCAVVKILGEDYKNISVHKSTDENGKVNYARISIEYENNVANINIGCGIELPGYLTVIGDKGTITITDDWWNTGYFEVKYYQSKHIDRHSFNFEGTGFRYLLQELLIILRDNRNECNRISDSESDAILEIINKI